MVHGSQLKHTQSKAEIVFGSAVVECCGVPAYEAIGSPEGMEAIAKSVEDMQLVNFGSFMFWGGPESMLNTEGGKDILGWTKAGLAQ
jgi:hypothetical protein